MALKASLNVAHLNSALALAKNAVDNKPLSYIQAAIMLSSENNNLVVYSQDDMTTMRVEVLAKIEEEGAICLPAKIMIALLDTLKNEDYMRISVDAAIWNAEIIAGSSRNNVKGFHFLEFPTMQKPNEHVEWVEFEAETLRNAVRHVIVAAHKDSNKPTLNGILFEFDENNKVNLVCADGYRLARETIEYRGVPLKKSYIVPHQAMVDALAVIKTADELVEIGFDIAHDRVYLRAEGVQMTTSYVPGRFPDYRAVFPKKFDTEMVIDRAAAEKAFKRCLVLAAVDSSITLSFEDKTLTLTAKGEKGNHEDVVAGELKGAMNAVYFNPKYLLDAIGAMSEDKAIIRTNGVTTGAIVAPVNGSTFEALIMPMSVTK